jgi:hypothetical protein
MVNKWSKCSTEDHVIFYYVFFKEYTGELCIFVLRR